VAQKIPFSVVYYDRFLHPKGMFFRNKVDFFDLLDKVLDDDDFRKNRELSSIDRAIELSDNEANMINELHDKLYQAEG
jgi:hypothetical protein